MPSKRLAQNSAGKTAPKKSTASKSKTVNDVAAAAAEPGASFKTVDMTSPGSLDIDSWFKGSAPSTGTMLVSNRPDLLREAFELENKRAGFEQGLRELQEAADQGVDIARRRLAERDPIRAQVRQITDRLEEIQAELRGTWIEVRFEGLDFKTTGELKRTYKNASNEEIALRHFVESGAIRAHGTGDATWTELSYEQWENLAMAIGQGQFGQLDQLHSRVTYNSTVTPDFSKRLSELRATVSS